MTAQHAFHVRLLAGAGDEYVRLHTPVPPEVRDQLARAGVSDYSIFVDGDDVFGVLRYDDAERVRRELADDVAPSWTQAVVALMRERPVDPATNLIAGMRPVFRFDSPDGDGGLHA